LLFLKETYIMTITKALLSDSVYNHSNFQKKQSIQIVDSILEIIKRTLSSGEDVMITRFGKFIVNEKDSRKGRNPQTGSDLQLDARRVVIFKCSGILRKKLNKKRKKRKS